MLNIKDTLIFVVVKPKFYRKFLRNMRGHFLISGHEIIVDNHYALIFDFGVEHLLFPKKNQIDEPVKIYICKDKQIVKKYRFKTKYLKNLTKELFECLEERAFEQLHIYDKI